MIQKPTDTVQYTEVNVAARWLRTAMTDRMEDLGYKRGQAARNRQEASTRIAFLNGYIKGVPAADLDKEISKSKLKIAKAYEALSSQFSADLKKKCPEAFVARSNCVDCLKNDPFKDSGAVNTEVIRQILAKMKSDSKFIDLNLLKDALDECNKTGVEIEEPAVSTASTTTAVSSDGVESPKVKFTPEKDIPPPEETSTEVKDGATLTKVSIPAEKIEVTPAKIPDQITPPNHPEVTLPPIDVKTTEEKKGNDKTTETGGEGKGMLSLKKVLCRRIRHLNRPVPDSNGVFTVKSVAESKLRFRKNVLDGGVLIPGTKCYFYMAKQGGTAYAVVLSTLANADETVYINKVEKNDLTNHLNEPALKDIISVGSDGVVQFSPLAAGGWDEAIKAVMSPPGAANSPGPYARVQKNCYGQ